MWPNARRLSWNKRGRMKRSRTALLFLLSFLFFSGGCRPNESISTAFAGQTYYLQYSAGDSQQWLNEYLPAGADFDSYATLFSVRSYDGLTATPQETASSVIYNLLAADPQAQYSFFPGANGDAGLHFTLGNNQVLEFDLFRFTMQEGHPFSLQFVYRVYPKPGAEESARRQFLDTVNERLAEWTAEMMFRPAVPIIREPKS